MIELLSTEEFHSLSRLRQQQYAEKAVMKLIEETGNQGVTLQELRGLTPFSISTISKYLDVLLAKRRIFKVTRGSVAFYFPNGTPLHKLAEQEITVGRKSYVVSLVQNNAGKNLYVQEMEVDNIGLKQVVGGVLIPATAAVSVSSLIKKVAKEKAELVE